MIFNIILVTLALSILGFTLLQVAVTSKVMISMYPVAFRKFLSKRAFMVTGLLLWCAYRVYG